MRPIKSRARTALLAMSILVLCLWKPWTHWLVSMITALLGFIGIREFQRMGRNAGFQTSNAFAMAATVAIVICGTAPLHLFPGLMISAIVIVTIGAFTVHMSTRGFGAAFHLVPISTFGPLYIGVPLALALQVMQGDRVFLMFGLLLVWLSDIGAYYVGRKYGFRKLAPAISPKKTVEGAFGGLASCILVGTIFKLLVPHAAFEYTWGEVFAFALIAGVIAPLGDLAESVLKRDSGIKDSGHGMGGHGGVLDRIDSLLFCFPAMYVFLMVTERL